MLRVTRRAMERAVLGVSLCDQTKNVEIRKTTRVTEKLSELKWQWAGHISRGTNGRWAPKKLKKVARNKRPMLANY
ncbi:jg14351 [Pararge aegeria aegeria]|uniref:Jg14351 protein n=1 Tax=Pararge aegeria aegeria TaxID=348720 RepID=A0A8S4RAX6_9NEOP|nr:jg14351 [Pararge aegeria aegeria]